MRKKHIGSGDLLNSLIQDELSAVETYQQALQKFSQSPAAPILRRFLQEHEETVMELKSEAATETEPATTSGAWGAWAKMVEGAAKMFGEDAALKALKTGEEHGANGYQRVLEAQELPESVREKITDRYLPRTREHIAALDALISKADVTGSGQD
jgi:hypothetical protein